MSADLPLIDEFVGRFRTLSPADREQYAARLAGMFDSEVARWLCPLLLHPPSQAALDRLKRALLRFERFLDEVRDSADPGTRALGVLARWAVAAREEDPDADDGS